VAHLQQEAVSVSRACRLLEVSRSGYHAHRRAKPSAQRLQEQTRVKAAFAASGASYGSRRVMHALRSQGLRLGRYRVRTLMREADLRPCWKRKFISTTDSKHTLPVARTCLIGSLRWLSPIAPGLRTSRISARPRAGSIWGRAGPLLAQDRGLVHGADHANGAGRVGAKHGVTTASSSARLGPSFGSRQPRRIQPVVATSANWRCKWDEHGVGPRSKRGGQ
jgi:hypothetical protein